MLIESLQRAMYTENLVKFGSVVFELCWWTDTFIVAYI